MKAGKKRLIFSTSCLIAAFALAVFTAYAWFVQFENVAAGGMNAKITSEDVISFEIDFYEVSLKTVTEDGTQKEYYQVFGDKIKPGHKDNKNDPHKWMPDYEPGLGVSEKTTAVLAHMKLRVSKSGTYTLKATTNSPVYVVKHTENNPTKDLKDFEENYLSNVISMSWVDKTKVTPKTVTTDEGHKEIPDTFPKTAIGTDYNFIKTATDENGNLVNNYFDGETYEDEQGNTIFKDEAKKSKDVYLYDDASAPSAPYTVDVAESEIDEEIDFYYFIDYMPEQIIALYYVMLRNFDEASLDEEITFNQDIMFEIGRTE